jgi:hypothetical protein
MQVCFDSGRMHTTHYTICGKQCAYMDPHLQCEGIYLVQLIEVTVDNSFIW